MEVEIEDESGFAPLPLLPLAPSRRNFPKLHTTVHRKRKRLESEHNHHNPEGEEKEETIEVNEINATVVISTIMQVRKKQKQQAKVDKVSKSAETLLQTTAAVAAAAAGTRATGKTAPPVEVRQDVTAKKLQPLQMSLSGQFIAAATASATAAAEFVTDNEDHHVRIVDILRQGRWRCDNHAIRSTSRGHHCSKCGQVRSEESYQRAARYQLTIMEKELGIYDKYGSQNRHQQTEKFKLARAARVESGTSSES